MQLDLRLAGEESTAAWQEVLDSLQKRQLGRPALAVIDGNPGLEAALQATWPQLDVKRCTNHKLWNLLAKAPAHLREELAEDYRRMIYAATAADVEKARVAFGRTWKLRCKAAWSSFEEAGDRLFPSCATRSRSGRRCGPPTRWSASTRSFADGPRRRRACRAKTPSCCCSSA